MDREIRTGSRGELTPPIQNQAHTNLTGIQHSPPHAPCLRRSTPYSLYFLNKMLLMHDIHNVHIRAITYNTTPRRANSQGMPVCRIVKIRTSVFKWSSVQYHTTASHHNFSREKASPSVQHTYSPGQSNVSRLPTQLFLVHLTSCTPTLSEPKQFNVILCLPCREAA